MTTNNLISLWKFNGNGNDFTNTLNGTPSNVTYKGGRNGLCGVFNGTSSYVNIPYNGLQDLGNSASTLTAWINTSYSYSTLVGIVFDNVEFSASATTAHRLYITTTTNKAVFFIRDSLGNSATLTSTNAVNTGKWVHIACTDDKTTAKMYINGVLNVSTSSSSVVGPINSVSDIQIGRYIRSNDPGSRWFNGSIDEVSYWSRALSSTEITEMYNSSVYPFLNQSNFLTIL